MLEMTSDAPTIGNSIIMILQMHIASNTQNMSSDWPKLGSAL